MARNFTGLSVVPFDAISFSTLWSCYYDGDSVISKGFFMFDDPIIHSVPLLMIQLGFCIVISSALKRLLKPLKQPRFVSDMLTGILLGPSIFGQVFGDLYQAYEDLFSVKETIMMDTLELLCFAFMALLVGVRTDMSVIKTSGKLAWVIGISAFILPVTLTMPVANLLGERYVSLAPGYSALAVLEATTSFQVTSILLEELNLLNSEIGRVALSASLISNTCGWLFKVVSSSYTRVKLYASASSFSIAMKPVLVTEGSRFLLIGCIVFILRPFMIRLMKKIPEGNTIKESHVVLLSCLFFGTAFVSEYLGLAFHFGVIIFGFAVPAGPPLGSGLVDKLGLFVSTFLVPAYVMDVGRRVNVAKIQAENLAAMEVLILLANAGKVIGAVIASRFFGMPYADSFSLGLILSSQGFFDILLFKRTLRVALFNAEIFTVVSIMAVVNAAVFTPLIHYLHDPSKRNMNYRRRTIEHCSNDSELRILVCIHDEESVFSVLNLLKASYPRVERPLGIYVLDMMELVGRDHPLIINHQFQKHEPTNMTRTGRIISAFTHYERHHEGKIKHQYYTAITPYSTMHDDVCLLALEKSTPLLIVPFQKSEDKRVRAFKKNILDKAPCSVGILVDKKIVTHFRVESLKESRLHICVIFTGGPDAREALAYSVQMAENPATWLTVIRFIGEEEFMDDMTEAKLDLQAITDLRCLCGINDRIEYGEVTVKDGDETSRALFSLDGNYDFILVGRRVDKDSAMVSGLTEWNSHYNEELGIFGDILASSDMKSNASVLVLQQQFTVQDHLKPKLR